MTASAPQGGSREIIHQSAQHGSLVAVVGTVVVEFYNSSGIKPGKCFSRCLTRDPQLAVELVFHPYNLAPLPRQALWEPVLTDLHQLTHVKPLLDSVEQGPGATL